MPNRYRGRFAPSPTGPLHFGSLVAALASYADARHNRGEWLVRMEDVDEIRAVPGAADDILRTLERFGFEWDGGIMIQSQRKGHYLEVIDSLLREGHAYHCGCSRAEIGEGARHGIEGPVYPGTCRNGLPPGKKPRTVRLLTDNLPIRFDDRIFGPQQQSVSHDIGDFVIRRADGFTAYQLAVVVDDQEQGINQVVRGADLLASTPRQILLLQRLGFDRPHYAHVPLVLDAQGRKLSKQDRAHPVNSATPLPALLEAWAFLCQDAPPEMPVTIREFWPWAIANWNMRKLSHAGQDPL